ncbi:MAG: hypothetical protein ACYC1Z_14020 [Georgenia sp.]
MGTVTRTTPDGYPAYARILHPVDPSNDEPHQRWADVARTTGRLIHPLVQWHALIGADGPHAHSSDLWDGGRPPQGNLPLPALQTLADLLDGYTATQTTAPSRSGRAGARTTVAART